MQDKSIKSKRKHRIGLVSKEHAQFAETLLEEIGIDIDLDGHKQFYLHEVLIKETAPHIMTATQKMRTP